VTHTAPSDCADSVASAVADVGVRRPSRSQRAAWRGPKSSLSIGARQRDVYKRQPEFSLTGSVDPRTHPERAIDLDDTAVAAIVEGTSVSGVAAVFGLAERSGPVFYITQAYAAGGKLLGLRRKRFLGEGEEGYTVGDESDVFRLGSACFGIVICAEGGFEPAWRCV